VRRAPLVAMAMAVAAAARLGAHAGPPFPIVSNQVIGRYEIDVWTDPDATDDGSLGGQFWVVLKPAGGATEIPAGTRVTVAIRAIPTAHSSELSAGSAELSAHASPVDGLITRQFAALLMDHEGRYAVRAAIDGPLGAVQVTSEVDATYDLRPAPGLFFVYLLPFVALGLLWMKVLWKRRGLRRPPPAAPAAKP
jgi:hypothetical protein